MLTTLATLLTRARKKYIAAFPDTVSLATTLLSRSIVVLFGTASVERVTGVLFDVDIVAEFNHAVKTGSVSVYEYSGGVASNQAENTGSVSVNDVR